MDEYRPSVLEDYVFTNEALREDVEAWVKNGQIPGHLLLSGHQGCGKTALARLLFKCFNVPKGDILEINGSQEGRLIDTLREKMLGFCQTWSLSGGCKYILIDEADYLNKESVQPALRNIMEKYNEHVRFILTCNYPAKILPALHSRCQQYHFEKIDEDAFLSKMITVLEAENIEYTQETLVDYYTSAYPDLRKCINLLQQNSISGTLRSLAKEENATGVGDYILDSTRLIRKGKINEARKLITSQAKPEEYPEIYRWMYQNLDLWGSDEETQNQAIVLIAKYLRNDAIVADQEINLAAAFCELAQLKKG